MVAGGELVRLAHQFVLDHRGQKTAPVGVPGKADLVRVEAKIRYRRLKASSQLIEAFGDARIETAFVGRKDHVVTPASEIGEQSAVVGGVADGTGVAMSEEHRRQRRIDGRVGTVNRDGQRLTVGCGIGRIGECLDEHGKRAGAAVIASGRRRISLGKHNRRSQSGAEGERQPARATQAGAPKMRSPSVHESPNSFQVIRAAKLTCYKVIRRNWSRRFHLDNA